MKTATTMKEKILLSPAMHEKIVETITRLPYDIAKDLAQINNLSEKETDEILNILKIAAYISDAVCLKPEPNSNAYTVEINELKSKSKGFDDFITDILSKAAAYDILKDTYPDTIIPLETTLVKFKKG